MYLFVEVCDDVIDAETSSWQADGIEIYFDGDYSHGGTYDGINDTQIRITVDDVTMEDINVKIVAPVDDWAFKFLLTDKGYNIEAAFSLESLQIYPSTDPEPVLDLDGNPIPNSDIAPNNIIGFEIQVNDNDGGGTRETMLRWYLDDNDSWANPSLFGQARLVGN